MFINVNYPMVLLLIPVAAAFIILTARKMNKLPSWRRRTVVTARVIAVIMIVMALSGFGIKNVSDKSTSIFLFDSSESTYKSNVGMEEFVREALKDKRHRDKVGIINFGADTAVEFPPLNEISFDTLQTRVNGNFTNIEQALKSAVSLIPSDERKRVVLLTDGSENAGDAIRQARLLKQQDITLDVFPVESIQGSDVQVKEVKVPRSLSLNEKFEIVVNVKSNVDTKGILKLYTDSEIAAEKEINIKNGENNFVFTDTAKKGGLVTYSAVIEPLEDSISKNNEMASFTRVEDVPRVLVIQDDDKAASELAKIMEDDIKIEIISPDNAPLDIQSLSRYDAFIISNVSAERLDDRFLDGLETMIQHQGKGLLVTGGDSSYAPGGYYKTPLETVLPVNMDIRPKEEQPNLGLALVIDKSGSMSSGQYGISKVELAKEAAIRATEVLNKDDMIGVIAFDDAIKWVVETQKLDNVKKVQDAIGTIRAGGGTQILPSLNEAYLSLKEIDTKLKHIILLTDGQAEKSGYETIVEGLRESGITLSTVAVGEGADSLLLKALAIGGKGRYYMTDEFSDIPKIFAKETFLAGKKYLNNRTFTPNLNSFSDILKGIDAVPTVDGYVATTAKKTARVIFSTDQDEPLLATWQYGLGRTAAWTSDAKGIWTSSWMSWGQSPRFWKNIMSWLIQEERNEKFSIEAGMESGQGKIELTIPGDEYLEGDSVKGHMIGPSGDKEEISLDPVSPGVYKGSFSGEETGVYIADLKLKNGDEDVKSFSTGVVVPYSPEYSIVEEDTYSFLERLAFEGGGRVLKDSREVFSGELEPVTSIIDITDTLIILAILLLLLDIALRRLNISFARLQQTAEKAYQKGSELTQAAIKPVASKLEGVKVKKHEVNKSVNKEEKAQEKKPKVKDKPADIKTDDKQSDDHLFVLLDKKRKRDR